MDVLYILEETEVCTPVFEVIEVKIETFLKYITAGPFLWGYGCEARNKVCATIQFGNGYNRELSGSIRGKRTRSFVHSKINVWVRGKLREPLNVR